MNTFICDRCNVTKAVPLNGGTGYGWRFAQRVCYDCCGVEDKQAMIQKSAMTLYLHDNQVQNWPGTLSLPVMRSKKGRHNIARTRCDVWFRGPDGSQWHGVQYGENTEILHCKRLVQS